MFLLSAKLLHSYYDELDLDILAISYIVGQALDLYFRMCSFNGTYECNADFIFTKKILLDYDWCFRISISLSRQKAHCKLNRKIFLGILYTDYSNICSFDKRLFSVLQDQIEESWTKSWGTNTCLGLTITYFNNCIWYRKYCAYSTEEICLSFSRAFEINARTFIHKCLFGINGGLWAIDKVVCKEFCELIDNCNFTFQCKHIQCKH